MPPETSAEERRCAVRDNENGECIDGYDFREEKHAQSGGNQNVRGAVQPFDIYILLMFAEQPSEPAGEPAADDRDIKTGEVDSHKSCSQRDQKSKGE